MDEPITMPKIIMFDKICNLGNELVNVDSIRVYTLCKKHGHDGYYVSGESPFSIRRGYIIPDTLAEMYVAKYERSVDGLEIENNGHSFLCV